MLRRNLGDTLRRKGCDDSFLRYKMLRRNPSGVLRRKVPWTLLFSAFLVQSSCLLLKCSLVEVLERVSMSNCHSFRTLVHTESKLGDDGTPISDPTLFRSLTGALRYLTFTRPDLAYAVQRIFLREDLLNHYHNTPHGYASYNAEAMCSSLLEEYKKRGQTVCGKLCGRTIILVVVDSLSKYAHFIPLTHPYTAITVAQAFLDNIYKLHELPKVIVTERDAMFLDKFWKEFNWIFLVEYWYNTIYHTSIHTTLYQVVCGQPPPTHIAYTHGDSRVDVVDVVDRSLLAREAAIQLLKFHLKRAHNMMKALADKHRTNREFELNSWVYLKLQPYR
ncbi:retrotransposon-related protein [Tanacetum coccineum]